VIAERGDIHVKLPRQFQDGHAGTARDLGPVQSNLYLHAGSLFWKSSPYCAIQGFSQRWSAMRDLMTDASNLSEDYGKNNQEDHEHHGHYADIAQVLAEMWIGQHKLLCGS